MQTPIERAPIYAIRRDDPEAADRVIGDLVDLVRSIGIEVAGVTQKNIHRIDRIHNDMHLVSLCGSGEYKISEDRGAMSSGCRLDRDLIARAAVDVERSLMSGRPQLLVLNKYGKAEEEGGGMRNAIALAIGAGIPVLMSVGRLSLGSLLDFAGHLVEVAEADRGAAKDWLGRWCPQLSRNGLEGQGARQTALTAWSPAGATESPRPDFKYLGGDGCVNDCRTPVQAPEGSRLS